ncbi:MAG: prenyltransferase [Haloarculaceae archaeon]
MTGDAPAARQDAAGGTAQAAAGTPAESTVEGGSGDTQSAESDSTPAGAGRSSRLRRLLVRSRPRFWLYLGGPALVGAVWGARTPGELLDPVLLAMVAYFLVPANVFLYGVNDVFDAEIDSLNPKKNPTGREVRFVPDRDAGLMVAVTVSGLVALPFAAVLPPAGVLAMLVFLALAIEYSAPPLRFKTTPLLDSLSNGLYVLPGVVTYAAVAGSPPPLLAIGGGWLWTMAMHTYSAIPDIEADETAGIRTTATVLGPTGALAYCLGCWLAAAVAFAVLAPELGLLFVVYPLFGLAIGVFDVDVGRAYWWFPVVNAVAGAALTIGGIWLLYGG